MLTNPSSFLRFLPLLQCMPMQLRVNFSNNSSLGAEQHRGEKSQLQVRLAQCSVVTL